MVLHYSTARVALLAFHVGIVSVARVHKEGEMNILAHILTHVGGGCLWVAIMLAVTGTWHMRLEDMTSAQIQVFGFAGGAVLCYIWAIMIVARREK